MNHLPSFARSTYTKLLLIGFVVAMVIFKFEYSVLADDQANDEERALGLGIETIYHVYYGSERIGTVDDNHIVQEFIDLLLKQKKSKYDDISFTLNEEIEMIPERVFQTREVNEETIRLLEEKIIILSEGYTLIIEDEEVAYVDLSLDEDEFKRSLILDFISEEELALYEEPNEEDLEIGDSKIVDIRFSKKIQWEKSYINPDDLYNIEDLLEKIQTGTLEKEIYKVEKGDVLGTIASDHDLSIKEIKEINPEITEDSLLRIGEEINVTVLQPMIHVTVEKYFKDEGKVPYQTIVEDDSDMWSGNTSIKQEGKEGKKITESQIVYENGRRVNREVISEEITVEPQDKIVVRGTKTSPSRGTGQLAWPAVGGYISSYQGNRWGRFHRGIDIARPSNYNILASDNGTVKSARWEGGYGNTIRINHNNGMETMYAHLQRMDVSVGQTVGKGQTIGRMGTTGNSTGIHLHFEVYKNGNLKNPMEYLNR